LLTLPRDAARQFRAVARKTLMGGHGRGHWPPVLCRSDHDGLMLEAGLGGMAVRYAIAGGRPDGRVAFRADALAQFEGRTAEPVALQHVGPQAVRATWSEGGVPRAAEFEAVEPDKVTPFPELPPKPAPMPDGFRAALAEASETAAREARRYALDKVLLRGRTGEVVASDGGQLLVQRGFTLPWQDDALVPRLAALSGPELAGVTGVALGRSGDHVLLTAGPWTFALPVDSHGRFPPFEEIVPRARPSASHLSIDPRDAALIEALPRLPGKDDDRAPVTLDLGGTPAVRARDAAGGPAVEVPLGRSAASGPPVRVVTDRAYLRRALQLGFAELQVLSPDKPLSCRDEKRIYVWMPLDATGAILPDTKPKRYAPALKSGPPAPNPMPTPVPTVTPTPRIPMPLPPTNNRPAHGANGAPQPPARLGPAEVIAEAEAVRSLLQDAGARLARLVAALKQQRRQTRAVQQVVQSLQQLRLDP
jgi:hypothetical protein